MKRFWLAISLIVGLAPAAFAHGTDGGFVLLLPARFYILGATSAVAASFLLLALLPRHMAEKMHGPGLRLFMLPNLPASVFSLVSFALLSLAIASGYFGTHDPLENPLPLFIWVEWWISFTLIQVVLGDMWRLLNPWSGVLAIIRAVFRRGTGSHGILKLPSWTGYSIALAQFFGFAWLELVDLAPYDPPHLANVVTVFWLFNLGGMLIFGEESWRARAEPFGIFFGLIGAVSPLKRTPGPETGCTSFYLVWPGNGLARRAPMSLSGSLFVLLTLSTVSYDGFSHTFLWVSTIGLNPLEYPGRSAVVWQATMGLAAAFVILSVLFFGCSWAGLKLAKYEGSFKQATGRLVYSIIPISIAFHAAHYFTYLLVEGQYALISASDPFARGWDLFGTAHWNVTTSFFYSYESVLEIWNIQTAAIVIGHIIGIGVAHLVAVQLFRDNSKVIRSQLFLAALMVLYTAFGLWVLASPRIG